MSSASDIITITHSKSGASVGIHPYGATVVSYKSADGRENLFVSSLAKLDGSKPIRGGIPLVFPIFGPPPKTHADSTMPQHGFARNNVWKVKEGSQHDTDSHSGISFTLDLKDVTNGRGENNPWSLEQAKVDGTSCSLTLDVKVDEKELTTTLVIVNNGTDAFDFNCLQHTYFKVENHAAQDPKECYVHGLGGFSIVDKVNDANSGKIVSYDDDITLAEGEVDKVHLHSEDHNTIKVKIGVGDGKTIQMEAFAEIDESPAPLACVVWNPSEEKAKGMSDFADEEYKDMICVEPGMLGHQAILHPGKEARFTQMIFA